MLYKFSNRKVLKNNLFPQESLDFEKFAQSYSDIVNDLSDVLPVVKSTPENKHGVGNQYFEYSDDHRLGINHLVHLKVRKAVNKFFNLSVNDADFMSMNKILINFSPKSIATHVFNALKKSLDAPKQLKDDFEASIISEALKYIDYGFVKLYKEDRILIDKCAELNNADCKAWVAYSILHGSNGYRQNIGKAFQLFEELARAGHPKSLFMTGYLIKFYAKNIEELQKVILDTFYA